MTPLRKLTITALAASSLAIFFAIAKTPGSGESKFAETYPGAWQNQVNTGLTQALSKHGANGCGEFYYRQRLNTPTELLVYCTPDGTHWTAYLVWPNTGAVIGPNQVATDIQLPR